MPNQNEQSTSRNVVDVPKFANGNVGIPLSTEVNQMVSEVPSGIKTSVQPTVFKPTLGSTPIVVKRNTVLANHTLNLPFIDEFTAVKSISKVIEDMANNYQRTHQDAFFEAWPQLLIRPTSETSVLTTAELRRDYRKYSARYAHEVVKMANASLMLIGSLANLLSMSRLNANDLFKTVAYETRWSKINSNTNYFSRIPGMKGAFEYIANNMKYALGVTSYGAEIVSFPLFKTEVIGNMGWATPGFDVLQNMIGNSQNGDIVQADIDAPTGIDAVELDDHLDALKDVLDQYYFNMKDITTVDGKSVKWSPWIPKAENGGSALLFSSTNDAEYGKRVKLNQSNKLARANEQWSNQITDALWNNYFYWQDYIIRNFSDYLDPNNDKYVFATSQIGILEPGKTSEEMLKVIRSNKNLDMVKDLLPRMAFKKDNNPTTATIVTWAPFITAQGETSFKDGESFIENYERYDVLNGDITRALQKSRIWPSIAPASFPGGFGNNTTVITGAPVANSENADSPLPFVYNTVPSVGIEGGIGSSNLSSLEGDNVYFAPVGKAGVFLDNACSRNLDPETTQITCLGVTAASAEAFIKGCDAVSYEEDPTTIRVLHKPLIDNTDLYQCGFNLVLSADNMIPSEIEKFFRTPQNFGIENLTPGAGVPSIKIGNDTYVDHLSIAPVLNKYKFGFVFLGGSIFDHPLVYSADQKAGNPSYFTKPRGYIGKLAGDIKDSANPGLFKFFSIMEAASRQDQLDANNPNNFSKLWPHKVEDSDPFTSYYYLQYFDTSYGPVAPVSIEDPIGDMMPSDVLLDNGDSVMHNSNLPAHMRIAQAAAVDIRGFGGVGGNPVAHSWNNLRDPAIKLMPFVDTISFKAAKADTVVGSIILMGRPTKIAFKTSNESWRTMMSRIISQFTGIEDTFPFWSHEAVKSAYSIKSESLTGDTSAMPEVDIMAAPRIERNRSDKKPHSMASYKSKTPNRPVTSDLASSMFSGGGTREKSGSADWVKKGKKKNKGGKFKDNPSYSKQSFDNKLDGISGDSNLVKSSESSSESNILDMTNKKEDSKFKKSSKSKIDAVSTQL